MDEQWYVYKNSQVEGPFTWEELSERVVAGTIDSDDLIWNSTGREWREAAKVPGLNYQEWLEINAYTTPVQKFKSFFSSLSINLVALIMVAIFLFSLSATSLYLHLSGDNNGDLDEPESTFFYDTIFGSDEEIDIQDNAQDDLESADGYPEESGIVEDNRFADNGSEATFAEPTDQTTEKTTENGSTIPAGGSDCDQEEEKAVSWRGGKYIGPSLNEKPHGKGLWKHPDGRNYAGDFEHGEITGHGTMTFSGGERYVGSFYQGKAHGSGTLVHPGGKSYSGEFRHGIIEGFGTMTFPGGEKYTGYFKNGVGHGQGTMSHPDGKSVSGTWAKGRLTKED